jgi:hypothetical protein
MKTNLDDMVPVDHAWMERLRLTLFSFDLRTPPVEQLMLCGPPECAETRNLFKGFEQRERIVWTRY